MCDNCQLVESNGYQCMLHAPGTALEQCTPAHAHGITWDDWESRRWAVLRSEYARTIGTKWGKRWPTAAEVEAARPILSPKSPAGYGMKQTVPNYRQYDRHKRPG
jgi:hypothetical protein